MNEALNDLTVELTLHDQLIRPRFSVCELHPAPPSECKSHYVAGFDIATAFHAVHASSRHFFPSCEVKGQRVQGRKLPVNP